MLLPGLLMFSPTFSYISTLTFISWDVLHRNTVFLRTTCLQTLTSHLIIFHHARIHRIDATQQSTGQILNYYTNDPPGRLQLRGRYPVQGVRLWRGTAVFNLDLLLKIFPGLPQRAKKANVLHSKLGFGVLVPCKTGQCLQGLLVVNCFTGAMSACKNPLIYQNH